MKEKLNKMLTDKQEQRNTLQQSLIDSDDKEQRAAIGETLTALAKEIADIEEMLKESAEEAGVLLKQLSCTQQNADHPILWNSEDTSYLKFYLFAVLERGK
jgi:septal ring factor EnvC (AmiA/AmiB activator)